MAGFVFADGFGAVIADIMGLVVFDFSIHVALSVQPELLFAGFIFKTQGVGIVRRTIL